MGIIIYPENNIQRMSDRTTATTIVPATPGSAYGRTAIPKTLMDMLKLGFGDKLEWEIDKDEQGWVIKLRPRKTEKDD